MFKAIFCKDGVFGLFPCLVWAHIDFSNLRTQLTWNYGSVDLVGQLAKLVVFSKDVTDPSESFRVDHRTGAVISCDFSGNSLISTLL